MKKFLSLFYKEITGLHEAAYVLAIFAILSQLLALFRDRILASTFGTTHTLDTYYAAFAIPDFIFVTVASLVSLSVLVPFLTERLTHSHDEAKSFITHVFSFFSLLIVGTSILAWFFIPIIAPKIFAGIPDSDALITLSRILLASPILLGISNFVASITQVGKRFLVYALSPVVYNIGIIVGVVYFYPIWGIAGLAWGVVLGAFFHLFIQTPFVWKSGLFKPWPFSFDWTVIRKIFFISIPRTLTLGMTQMTILVLVALASHMQEGSVTIFNFSKNLQAVPLSIIGVSYSLAAFPTLAQFVSRNEWKNFTDHIIVGARHMIFWLMPISVLFIVLRAQIVRTIYGAGQFDWNATRLTAAALAIFAVSVLAQSLVLLFVRSYYAKGDTKKSLYAGLTTGILSVSLSFGFASLFTHAPLFRSFIESLLRVNDITGTEVLALALGFSCAQIVNVILLWVWFSREHPGFSATIWRTLFQSFSASVIAGFVAYLGLNLFDNIFDLNTLPGIFLQGMSAGVLGIFALIGVLYALKSEELSETYDTLHKKFWQVRPIIPDAVPKDISQ